MRRRLVLVGGLVAAALAGCGGGSDDDGASVPLERKRAVAEHYADIVDAAYSASIASTERMRDEIDRFLDHPTQQRLEHARRAWVAARDDYIVTEPFRFYGGPIDDPKTGVEGQINAWPMDEAYVDYVRGDRTAGIVNDRKGYPTITNDVIVAANERDGETNISTGWHAIEFLLWGQDFSATGPGDRPASDYATAPNAARRARYLRLVTDRLLHDLHGVRAPWTSDGTFRASFVGDPTRAIKRIMRGIGALSAGELSGERMAVALESGDQEDEHSCFSDNTNADVVNDLRGIRMVYRGSYPGLEGPGVDTLLADVDPGLAKQITAKIDANLAAARAFPATFERMIAAPEGSRENRALADEVTAIEQQGDLLAKAARALGVPVSFGV